MKMRISHCHIRRATAVDAGIYAHIARKVSEKIPQWYKSDVDHTKALEIIRTKQVYMVSVNLRKREQLTLDAGFISYDRASETEVHITEVTIHPRLMRDMIFLSGLLCRFMSTLYIEEGFTTFTFRVVAEDLEMLKRLVKVGFAFKTQPGTKKPLTFENFNHTGRTAFEMIFQFE